MTSLLPAFAAIVEQAPDAILLVDATGTIVYANRRVTALFGSPERLVVGKAIEMLIPERHRERHRAHRTQYAASPANRMMGDQRFAFIALRADGGEFPVDIQLAPIEVEGQRWTMAIVRDATDRHRFLDELRSARNTAERVARVKADFLALAAHDLSQPVQTLELAVSAIERCNPGRAELAELTALSTAALSRMRELLKMLLEISRLESGTVDVITRPVRIAEICEDVERQFIPLAQAKALRFVSEPCKHVIETDPILLRGMLSNLVSNAIRYTPDGEIRVQCTTPADGGLQLDVRDTGIGIPGDRLETIFEDFCRLDDAERMYRDGFGLGLAIVRRLSKLLGFPVKVRSELGRGSSFGIHIPAASVHSL